MKNLAALAITICFFSNVQTNQFNELFLNIQFQEEFSNDTVSLKVNDVDIFSNRILNTDSVIGFANVTVLITKTRSKLLKIQYLDDGKFVKIRKDVELSIKLNGKYTLYKVDVTKGKYLGINKRDDVIYINQKKTKFQYD